MTQRNLFRVLGTLCLGAAIVLIAATIPIFFESDDPLAEVVFLPVVVGVLVLGGVTLLRQVERPIYGSGVARQRVSAVLLILAVLFGFGFVGLLSESEPLAGDLGLLLFFSLVSGASGLVLRGTNGFGSFRNSLTLLGIAAVSVPMLLLLFVFSSSSETVTTTADGTEITVIEGATPAVLVAVVMLLVGGVAAVWLWAKRAVAPMSEITAVANEIQAGSLDRRIALDSGTREVRALADSFDDMLDRLARSSGAQQQMIEDASHELRTPLTALALNNELLLEADTPTIDDYRKAAERNRAITNRLQTTIDELLNQGRATNLELQQVDNDLMAIVNRVADQHRAINPTIPIVVSGPRSLPLGIDGPSVQRALVNLIENAARYSPDGVPVEVEVVAGESSASLSVTDHGPGVPAEDQDVIFERYYQGDPSDSQGIGIGLALVKHIAEAHGSLELISPVHEDRGTRFIMRFGVAD